MKTPFDESRPVETASIMREQMKYGERKFIIHPDRHDLRAIGRAAALDDDADTHADDDAAKDRREERIRRRGLHRLEIG